jgi:hypothetical protein
VYGYPVSIPFNLRDGLRLLLLAKLTHELLSLCKAGTEVGLCKGWGRWSRSSR